MLIHDLALTFDDKEKETYSLLCLGLTNLGIGERLGVTEHTIKKRLQSIYKKLGVESDNPTDKQSARRRAIQYSGTKIEQSVSFKTNDIAYTEDDIRNAAKKITWHKPEQIREILSDLFLVLEKKI